MKPIFLDIMLNGVYKGQLKYTKRGFPTLVNGEWVEGYDYDELVKFVEGQRPSLQGKPFEVLPSNQRV